MSKLWNYRIHFAMLCALLIVVSCSKDDLVPAPTAAFTAEVDDTNTLSVTFTNTSLLATSYQWNFGDGETSTDESPTHVYDEAGTYTVTLTATNEGGSSTASDDVTVVAVIVDIVEGGDMTNEDAWTVENAGMTATTVEFTDGKLVVSNPVNSQTNVKIYQALEVEAGKTYKFSANIKGSGATNSWLEVLFGTAAPEDGVDYTDGKYTGLNTWNGCGGTAFDADLAEFGCQADVPGTGADGEVTFANSGTVYLVIKAGSWDGTLGEGGIEIDDVKLIEQ